MAIKTVYTCDCCGKEVPELSDLYFLKGEIKLDKEHEDRQTNMAILFSYRYSYCIICIEKFMFDSGFREGEPLRKIQKIVELVGEKPSTKIPIEEEIPCNWVFTILARLKNWTVRR